MDVSYLARLRTRICGILFRLCVRILKSRHLPTHIAFIADGNRTFSKRHEIPLPDAYIRGMEKIIRQIQLSDMLNVSALTFFLYSSHNNRREESHRNEVLTVIEVFLQKLLSCTTDYRFNIIGETSALPSNIHSLCNQLIRQPAHKEGKIINLAINYSGKSELVDIFHELLQRGLSADDVTPNDLATSVTCPDLVIRTSGQRRLSDFLLWQTVHSIMFFTDQCWPEFSNWCLLKAIFCYQFYRNNDD